MPNGTHEKILRYPPFKQTLVKLFYLYTITTSQTRWSVSFRPIIWLKLLPAPLDTTYQYKQHHAVLFPRLQHHRPAFCCNASFPNGESPYKPQPSLLAAQICRKQSWQLSYCKLQMSQQVERPRCCKCNSRPSESHVFHQRPKIRVSGDFFLQRSHLKISSDTKSLLGISRNLVKL